MWAVIKRLTLGISLIVVAAAVLLVSDLGRRTPRGPYVSHVAILQPASQGIIDEGVRGILDALAEHGFVDGKNLAVRRYNAEGDAGTANAIAKEIIDAHNELIITVTTLSLQAVANANRQGKTRHVFALVSDPAGAGVGISRDDPRVHPPWLTGYGTMEPVAETIRVARQLFPRLKTVGTVWNPGESNSEANVRLARATCRELGIELFEANADNSAGVKESVGSLLARGVQALWIGGDVTVMTAIDAVVAAAHSAKLPVFTSIPGSAERGALFDVGANHYEVGRIAGALAARVLHGTDPASVAVENVMPERVVINRQALQGLTDPWTVPADVARRAEFVGEAAAPTEGKKEGRP